MPAKSLIIRSKIWHQNGAPWRVTGTKPCRAFFAYNQSPGLIICCDRLRSAKQTINGETIYSVYNLAGQLTYRFNATNGQPTDQIKLAGKTIARLKNASGLTYLHEDHLGTPVVATHRDTGAVLWRESFTPYGESLNAPTQNDDNHGFTGHIRDTDTGLTYMQARYYDPVIGRFLANDPVGFASGGVDYFNRYSYTANNPVNAIDPDGEVIFQLIVGAAAAVGGAAADAAIQGVQIATGSRESFDGLQTLRAGAISGATGFAAATCGTCAVAVAGALSGAEQAGVALVQGDSAGEALAKGVIGATVGAVTAGKGGGLGTRATAGLAVKALKGQVPVSAPFAAQAALSAGAAHGITSPVNEVGGAIVDQASQGLSDLGSTLKEHGMELVESIEAGCGITPDGPC